MSFLYNILPLQKQYVFQQQYDSQLYNSSPTLIKLNENYDETYLASFVIYILTKKDDDKDQDPDEKSG
ncbi:3233_t:CDS:2 [Funneliformis geosporum]|uniref:3233_t:CDS:1 n=1 Tax=Funneliformis geosporum TaxID=1117311 RepID=A0A9W4SL83_9GLOM|nr:3233_t:CDS:2 [Funneliformis geosporum]